MTSTVEPAENNVMAKPPPPGKAHGRKARRQPPGKHGKNELQPAQEWGERIATGKTIARGGRSKGQVPGVAQVPGAAQE
jgi:hypothetical protein